MLRLRHFRWAICGALVAAGVGCHSETTPQDEMAAAQNALLDEAFALSQCERANGYAAQRCADQRAAYDRDLAAFKAKYGR